MNLKPHETNALNNFIAGWYSDDTSICDALIQYHTNSPDKLKGLTMSGAPDDGEDKDVKDSNDVILQPSDLAQQYLQMVNAAASEYVAQYPWSGKLVPWGIIEPMIIQHHEPGGGYERWHFAKDNTNEQVTRRHLTFTTYLSDAEDGGTEFFHQKLTLCAEKGLTLIWPAGWDFTHRGLVSRTEHGYVVTGCFSTYTKEQYERLTQQFGGGNQPTRADS